MLRSNILPALEFVFVLQGFELKNVIMQVGRDALPLVYNQHLERLRRDVVLY